MSDNNKFSHPHKQGKHGAAPGQKGYVPPASNPYLASLQAGNVPEFDVIKPEDLEPTPQVDSIDLGDDIEVLKHSETDVSQHDKKPRKSKTSRKTRIILWTLVGVIAAFALVFYFIRPVSILVNGKRLTFSVNTSIGTVLSEVDGSKDFAIKPGNLVSVNGNLLKEGEGHPYSLTVNGQTLEFEDAQYYRVHSDDELVFSDGTDKMEDYSVEEERVEPVMTKNGAYGSVAYISQWGKPGIKEIRTGKISGEVSKSEMKEPVQDVIVQYLNIAPKDGEKLVALTFDDGPSIYTDDILAILKKENVKATFFMLGENVKEMPGKVKDVMNDGHQIANHTMTHRDLVTLDKENVLYEMNSGFEALANAGAPATTAVRPPYGSLNMKTWLQGEGKFAYSFLWTKDSEDWRRPGAEAIVRNCTASNHPGDIILLHDGGGDRTQDIEALPQIIANLKAKGYRFVTLTELLKSDERISADVVGLDNTMPADTVWPTEIATY